MRDMKEKTNFLFPSAILSLACGEQERSGLRLRVKECYRQGLGHSSALSPLFILVENSFLATTHLVGLLVYLLKLQLEQISH